jgi:hypothetical protein
VGNHPGNTGGKKGRSGRKPWAFRDEMRQALEAGEAGKVVQRIISGDILEEIAQDDEGEPIYGDTKNADRLKAIQLAASYAEGLPVQPTVDLTPEQPVFLTASELVAIARRLQAVEVSGRLVE